MASEGQAYTDAYLRAESVATVIRQALGPADAHIAEVAITRPLTADPGAQPACRTVNTMTSLGPFASP